MSACRYGGLPGLSIHLHPWPMCRSEEHTSELQSQSNLVCRLLLEKKIRRPRASVEFPARVTQSAAPNPSQSRISGAGLRLNQYNTTLIDYDRGQLRLPLVDLIHLE